MSAYLRLIFAITFAVNDSRWLPIRWRKLQEIISTVEICLFAFFQASTHGEELILVHGAELVGIVMSPEGQRVHVGHAVLLGCGDVVCRGAVGLSQQFGALLVIGFRPEND